MTAHLELDPFRTACENFSSFHDLLHNFSKIYEHVTFPYMPHSNMQILLPLDVLVALLTVGMLNPHFTSCSRVVISIKF